MVVSLAQADVREKKELVVAEKGLQRYAGAYPDARGKAWRVCK